jgi:gamma-glutamylcysteine synthetase
VKSVLDRKNHYVRDNEIQITTDFERASLEFLGRVHSAEYLTFVNNLSKELEKKQREEEISKSKNMPSIIPFTPMVRIK